MTNLWKGVPPMDEPRLGITEAQFRDALNKRLLTYEAIVRMCRTVIYEFRSGSDETTAISNNTIRQLERLLVQNGLIMRGRRNDH
jgi:hypothetical protein